MDATTMPQETPEHQGDEVQVFDVAEALKKRDHLHGRVDMARSSGSYIAVFQTPPRGGETHIHQHPDSDQILFVLQGECTVEGLSGTRTLHASQGVLIPAGVHYGFTNTAEEDLVFLSMRTESSGGRRVAYVRNVVSDVKVSVPEDLLSAKGFGSSFYVYALDSRTFGLSPVLMEDWNRASLLRMNCKYTRRDGVVEANLPERIAQWYQLSPLAEADFTLVPDPDRFRVRVVLHPQPA